MKILALLTAIFTLSLSTPAQITLTANDSIEFTAIELNADPNQVNGPNYNYWWLPSGYSMVFGTPSGEPVVITGPGWYLEHADFDWNQSFVQFYPNQYEIEVICGVPVVQYYFIDGLYDPWFGAWYSTGDGWTKFFEQWALRGGTYTECIPAVPLIARKSGKRFGHSK